MPERCRVNITRRACADLDAIHRYIEQDSPQNAAAVATRIVEAIDTLELLPDRYPIRAIQRQGKHAVRRMPVPPFLIYYRVDEATRAVDIITIRHGSRRQPRSF